MPIESGESAKHYEERLEKMSIPELKAETRKVSAKLRPRDYENRALADVLAIVLDSHERGLTPYLR